MTLKEMIRTTMHKIGSHGAYLSHALYEGIRHRTGRDASEYRRQAMDSMAKLRRKQAARHARCA